jgi:hypothetical protein
VKSVATAGRVHGAWATACSKTTPAAAIVSTFGVGLGVAP